MQNNGICVLYAASTVGHLRSFHYPYLRALQKRGDRVIAAAAGAAEDLPEGVEYLAVPFTKRYLARNNLRAVRHLAAFLRREKVDLVLTHTSLAAFFTRLAVWLAGKRECRVINVVHGYLFDERSSFLKRTVLLLAEKLLAGVTDEILTMNRQDTLIARKHRLCRGSVTQIPGMGLEISRFGPASAEEKWAARHQLGLPETAFVMIYGAEFSKRKNQPMLLQALSKLPEDIYLLLPGRGDRLEECRRQAEELGLRDRVVFPGFVTDLRPWLQAADLGVSSSRSEGLPFNVMEAMAAGLPCVVSRVKGHEDLVQEGVNGCLYDYNDEQTFCRAVLHLKQEEMQRRDMGRAGRRRAEGLALERVFDEVMAHYR